MIQAICDKINQLINIKENITIAIDGKSGSGKTTLANYLTNKYQANIIHCDNFFLPLEKRNEKNRLSQPGGNIDYERLKNEVIDKLHLQHFKYSIYDCKTNTYTKKIKVYKKKITIIEGSYSMHPYFNKYYDMSIFMDLSNNLQKQRILKRNGKDKLNDFIKKWIPLENHYLKKYNIKNHADFIILEDFVYQQFNFDNIRVGYINNSKVYLNNFDYLLSLIPKYYQKHISKYNNKIDKLNSLLCYLLLKQLIDKKINIIFTENGKPIADNNEFYFSFSHKENKVICCICDNIVGIDIEKNIVYNDKLAQKICSESELLLINNDNKNTILTSIWTKKESYIKMIDLKHSFAFKDIKISDCKFIEFLLDNNIHCCIAYK